MIQKSARKEAATCTACIEHVKHSYLWTSIVNKTRKFNIVNKSPATGQERKPALYIQYWHNLGYQIP